VLTAENLRTQVVELWRSTSHADLDSIFLVTHNIAEAVFMASRIVIISSHPGRIRTVIQNPLLYPRDVNSSAFGALVEQVHAAITALALPDEPAEGKPERMTAVEMARHADAEPAQSAGRGRVEPIPNVPVETIVGLLEIIEDAQETINVFDLSVRIGKEFGETIATVKAAEMLGLVDTPKDDVLMTEKGWYFLAAPTPARKGLFRQAIMRLRLFQILSAKLAEAPEHRIDAESIREDLAKLLPYDHPAKLLETLVAWGRYAELIDFDQHADAVHAYEDTTTNEDDETSAN
jgi:NitT/TauT family transport system ATP-binding protein